MAQPLRGDCTSTFTFAAASTRRVRCAASGPRPRRARAVPCPWWWALAVCAWTTVAASFGALGAERPASLDRTVKAAYLHKLPGYVEWPPRVFPGPGAPFVIGVIGSDGVLDELRRIAAERMVADRPLDVRRVRDAGDLNGVQVLFVGRVESARLPELARAAQQHSTLVVSEVHGGLRLGSVINLVLVEGRVRFEVALDAADRSGVKLSSRLLALAQTVRPSPGRS